jgi:DNA-binding MarR family transcriptional regulator
VDAESYILRSRAMARLVFVSQRFYRMVTALVRRFELTESQYNALRVLRGAERRGEELTQADLADRLIASRANTTWILDRLEERKLIRRRGHSDRRKNLVDITPAGHKLLQRIDPEFGRMLDAILIRVSDEELTAMQDTLDRLEFQQRPD